MYTDAERAQIMSYALKACGKFLRDTPPGDMDAIFAAPDNMISIVAGGATRDPEGKEWVNYWIGQGVKQFEKEKDEELAMLQKFAEPYGIKVERAKKGEGGIVFDGRKLSVKEAMDLIFEISEKNEV